MVMVVHRRIGRQAGSETASAAARVKGMMAVESLIDILNLPFSVWMGWW